MQPIRAHRLIAQDAPSQIVAKFQLRTLGETVAMSEMVAQFFPDPARSHVGIWELLTNGIEHGNLGIGYAQKGALLRSGEWESEIERRLLLPEHSAKQLCIEVFHAHDCVGLFVRDAGRGFDWKRYLEIDPQRARDLNGRGIALARSVSFDALHYSASGNEVWAICHKH